MYFKIKYYNHVQGGRVAGTLSWAAKSPRKAGDSTVFLWTKVRAENTLIKCNELWLFYS